MIITGSLYADEFIFGICAMAVLVLSQTELNFPNSKPSVSLDKNAAEVIFGICTMAALVLLQTELNFPNSKPSVSLGYTGFLDISG